jgi:hypothetical protein
MPKQEACEKHKMFSAKIKAALADGKQELYKL